MDNLVNIQESPDVIYDKDFFTKSTAESFKERILKTTSWEK